MWYNIKDKPIYIFLYINWINLSKIIIINKNLKLRLK